LRDLFVGPLLHPLWEIVLAVPCVLIVLEVLGHQDHPPRLQIQILCGAIPLHFEGVDKI
jgi:hypothetical protein